MIGLLAIPAAIMSAALFAAAATGSSVSPIFTIIMLLVVVVYQLILFAAQYVSFREIFGTSQLAGESTTDEGQLVA